MIQYEITVSFDPSEWTKPQKMQSSDKEHTRVSGEDKLKALWNSKIFSHRYQPIHSNTLAKAARNASSLK